MRKLEGALNRVIAYASMMDRPLDRELVRDVLDPQEAGSDEPPPGFGHRFHTRDPRAARLFQMALELEVEAEHIQMIRAVETILNQDSTERKLPGAP